MTFARQASRRDVLALAAASASAITAPVWAQPAASTFPSKPLKVIVPQPPGGGFDFVARVLAEPLAKALGQPVVVENRTGSGTMVGTDAAAKADPDGYTLLTGSVSNLALNMGLYKAPPYNSLRDFEPVGLAVAYPYVLMARKDLPQKTLADVLTFAKASPGKLSYASAGNGSGQHVLAAALWNRAKVDVTHIPYRGSQPAYQDLLGGRVDLFFDLWSTARVHVESGSLTPLAVSGAARLPSLPQVQTLAEAGQKIELESWFGFFVPAKTPQAVQAKLRTELQKVVASKEVAEILRKAGGQPLNLQQAETVALVKRDVERWSKAVRDLGVQPD